MTGRQPAVAVDRVKANELAYVEAFMVEDLEALMDTFADDAVFIDETFADHLEGKTAIRDMYAGVLAATDKGVSEVLDRFVADDGTMATSLWQWAGVNPNGGLFHLPLALVHAYRGGKITREIVYYASPNAVEQVLGSG